LAASGSDGVVPLHHFDNARNFSLIGLPSGTKVRFLSSPDGKDFAGELDNIEYTEEQASVGDNPGYSVYRYTFE